MDKNKKIVLMSILVAILVLGIGVSFAYFTVGINVLGKGGETKIVTGGDMIKVTYDAGTDKLATENLKPGDAASKGFKVIVEPNKPEQEVTYRIYLNITSNTFVVCSDSNYDAVNNDCIKDAEELYYVLKDANGREIARGDLTNGVTGEVELARETKKVTAETEFNYTIEVEYKDTNKDQNHNKNKTLIGTVKVEFAEPDNDTADLSIVAIYVAKESNPSEYTLVNEVPANKVLNNEKTYCEVNGRVDNSVSVSYDASGKITVANLISKTKCTLYFDN